jgi:hypothetical protein
MMQLWTIESEEGLGCGAKGGDKEKCGNEFYCLRSLASTPIHG